MSKSAAGIKLTAKWQLDAALLSRPVDLTPLVAMSRNYPDKFLEDNTLHRLVSLLLNEKNSLKSDKDTKLDVLNILANVAGGSPEAVSEVRVALQGINEWFDEYIRTEEEDPTQEPELHKAMVLLLARCWDYKLKTEDVLELTQGNRRIALCTVVGLLEDGETYSTELKQRQKPAQGQIGQWEHELVCQRYEKPLLLQICRLLRGFTHPGTYFEASDREIALYSVDQFAIEMNTLLEITLRSRLVEKLSVAMYDCLFEEEKEDGTGFLDGSDHIAVTSVHAFLQNMYFYASQNNDEYRRHMLMDTLLIPRLILPYLDRCVMHLNNLYDGVSPGEVSSRVNKVEQELVRGIAASLRTLVIATFRAPATQFVMTLMRRLNPTASILKANAFCCRYDYIFSLLCLLNVNMGALDLSRTMAQENSVIDAYHAHSLLFQLATVYSQLDKEAQTSVYKRLVSAGALPVSRDTPSYVAVMSVLHGGAAGQLEYVTTPRSTNPDEDEDHWDIRAEAKRAAADRMALIKQAMEGRPKEEEKGEESNMSAFQTAVAVAKIMEDQDPRIKTVGIDNKAEEKYTQRERERESGRKEEKRRGDKGEKEEREREKSRASSFRLLGDLPTLGAKKNKDDVKVALALELPQEGTKYVPKMMVGGREVVKNKYDPSIPKEFLCAINGHVMKEPVRATTSGLVFERATIELWLSTRGSVCPITQEALYLDDLEPENELRSKIMRYHIQQTSLRTSTNADDDLYDF